ncbi:MAG: hypothetical protein NTW69_09755 [Chloroflexi bacterium]|nr:hypothetical protein [Chloroflexota bacterium]
MKRHLSILFLLTLLLSACASVATTATVVSVPTATDAPPQVIQPAASKVLFQIIKADGTKFDVTLDAVKVIPLTQITVEGKVQEGPKLSDVLALAGVTDFTEVTINGSSAPSTLIRTQVDDNTILDFSNRGTMKLATTYIPKVNWTKDITDITVK